MEVVEREDREVFGWILLAKLDNENKGGLPGVSNHLIPTTIESGPQGSSTRVFLNPASRIQALQSAPVNSKPALVSISMVRLLTKPSKMTSGHCGILAQDSIPVPSVWPSPDLLNFILI
jgi:hypothetical protein